MNKYVGFLLILIFVLSGCSGSTDKSNIVAEFKGGCLTAEDLDAHYQVLRKSAMFRNKSELLTPEFVFEHALNMEMIITRGLGENLHKDPWIRARIHEFMSSLFLKAMQDSLVSPIDKNQFTDEELRQFYQDHQENYIIKPIYTVGMIKTRTLEDAEKALAFISSQPDRFETAAGKYSIDPGSRKIGGSIGSRALSRFGKNWQPVIGALETGKISGPHHLGKSFYLFKLIKKSKPVHHSFDERKAYIKNDLLYAKYKQAWQKTYEKLKKEYNVSIHQKNLSLFIKARSKPQGENS